MHYIWVYDFYTLLLEHETTPEEREELRIALTAAQESAIIQLLLEVCLPTPQDRQVLVV